MDRDRFDISTVDSIISILHNKCSREQEHSKKVSELCMLTGAQMKLPESQLKKLELRGIFMISEKLYSMRTLLTEQEN
jgi:HD-GYP domain-containing protein (c-di-GMP phosphodiesterase class II)